VAAEQDAARDRVLAARTAFDAELTGLGASARDAVDIPAKVRRSPAKAVAVVGGIAFLLMRGPQRILRGLRSRLPGRRAPLPKRMLPPEIEKDAKSFIRTGAALAKSPHWTARRQPFLLETSRPGVFAAGDVRSGSAKRVASAVGEGAMAVLFVHEYLKDM